MTGARGRSRLVVAVPAAAVLIALALLRSGVGGPRAGRAVDDLTQLAAAALACVACAWRAQHHEAGFGRPWGWLAGATGAWAAGEVLWSYDELILGRDTPFPSLADAGFLLFEVLAVIGLLTWPAVDLIGKTRSRALLDASRWQGHCSSSAGSPHSAR